MPTMNVSLPEAMKEFIDQQVSSGRYGTASEYVRELVRQDEKRRAQERLEELLLAGLNSGAPKEMAPQDWKELRREARALIQSRKARKKRG